MKRLTLFFLLLLTLALLAACGGKKATTQPTTPPQTEQATPEPAATTSAGESSAPAAGDGVYQVKDPCFIDMSQSGYQGKWECGVLTVPQDHGKPDGPTVALGVIRLFPTGDNPKPDPLILLQGGPGGSIIQLLPNGVTMTWLQEVNKDREIIFVDQRGTRYSEPALFCQDYGAARAQAAIANQFREKGVEQESKALVDCALNAHSKGVDIPAFNSVQNAADIKALRDALGFEQINLYGVSYGTLLSQHIMQQYPEMLRTVTLDGVFPMGQPWVKNMGEYKTKAYERFVQSCAQDGACNETYPDMDKIIPALFDKLEKQPEAVTLTDNTTGQTAQAALDGDLFATILMNNIYRTSFYDDLLAGLKQANEGDFSFFARQVPTTLMMPDLAVIMHFSTVCEESANFTMDDVGVEKAPELLQGYVEMNSQVYLDVCGQLKLPPLPAEATQPVKSDAPTLILSGAFDPATPAQWVDDVTPGLSHAYSLLNPAGGHGQLPFGVDDACIAGIFTAFLNNPATEPDASCLKNEELPY